jgi:hypothetical protein
LILGRTVVRPTGEPGLHAERGQPALEPGREVPDDLGLGEAVGLNPAVVAAVAGVEHDALAEQARPGVGDGHHVAQ